MRWFARFEIRTQGVHATETRPQVIDQQYLIDLLEPKLGGALSREEMGTFVDLLIRGGVIVWDADDGLMLAKAPNALSDLPDASSAALVNAIRDHLSAGPREFLRDLFQFLSKSFETFWKKEATPEDKDRIRIAARRLKWQSEWLIGSFRKACHEPAMAIVNLFKTRIIVPLEALDGPLSEGKPAGSTCSHSPDFTTVSWFGEQYTFTKGQAALISLLWRAWQAGNATLTQETIEDALQRNTVGTFRVRDTFKRKGRMHPAWGKMIASPRKGVYGLAGPPGKTPKTPT